MSSLRKAEALVTVANKLQAEGKTAEALMVAIEAAKWLQVVRLLSDKNSRTNS